MVLVELLGLLLSDIGRVCDDFVEGEKFEDSGEAGACAIEKNDEPVGDPEEDCGGLRGGFAGRGRERRSVLWVVEITHGVKDSGEMGGSTRRRIVGGLCRGAEENGRVGRVIKSLGRSLGR